ncbi:hypothetical protein [Deinococcus ruber]|uniref:Uncharacterized protein n=1 Tax=Deinococcus ruber TaxID=1848197 RepID=A0A918FBP4_9DEIO|nr:hypothetical protein [Deinococcus ruber]GGR28213.1 hypothetical protein GCM10008957_44300 [Deinococcus ruber]
MIADPAPPLSPFVLTRPRFERVGALLTLLGIMLSFFGLSWDIQWHADVGPDTFWTLPHLFVYSGSTLTGLACLTVSLISSSRFRTHADPSWIPVLGGRFHAPTGFVITGLGALSFLLFGLFDQWWHTKYGFDVTLNSPPHIGLLVSLLACMGGTTLMFVQGQRIRPLEFSVSVAVSLGFALPVLTFLLLEMHQNVQFVVFPVLFFSVAMLLVAAVTRTVWWVLAMTLVFAAFRTFHWYGIPLFDQLYAHSLGYEVRPDARGFAYIPFLMPMFAPLAGLTVSAVLAGWQKLGWHAATGAATAAGLAAPLLYLDGSTVHLAQTPALIPLLMVLGAAFGWVGWQLGTVLRPRRTVPDGLQASSGQ